MKKLRFIFISLLHIISIDNSYSHTYVPFPKNNALWIVDVYFDCPPHIQIPTAEYQYSFSGDTFFNSVSYKKLNRSGVTECFPTDWGYVGALRDDTLMHVVYFIPKDSLSEQVLYDFNLNFGDTVHGYFDCGNNITVTQIDSIVLGGILRKRISIGSIFSSCYYTGAWAQINSFYIEGIGSRKGLIDPLELNGIFSFVLNCFSDSTGSIFPNTSTSCILLNTGNSIENISESIEINPNPINQNSILRSNKYVISKISIYNLLDQKIIEKDINALSFPLGKLINSSGIFICNIKLINGSTITKKIIHY